MDQEDRSGTTQPERLSETLGARRRDGAGVLEHERAETTFRGIPVSRTAFEAGSGAAAGSAHSGSEVSGHFETFGASDVSEISDVLETAEILESRSARARVDVEKLKTAGGFSDSRAREAENCRTLDERMTFIIDTMARLEWVRGRSGRYLAHVWRVAQSTVGSYAAEASRFCTADAETARRDITLACNKVMRHAMDANDSQGVKSVGTLLAQVSGALAPIQQQIEVSGPATPAQAARLVREAFGDKVISEHDEPALPDVSSG